MEDLEEYFKLRKLKSEIERLGYHKQYFFQLMFDSDFIGNHQIAKLCKCTMPTIRHYMRMVSKLFGVKDRRELILLCLDLDKIDRMATILNKKYVQTMTRNPCNGGKYPSERLPIDDLTNEDWRTVIEHQKFSMRNKIKKFDQRLKEIEEEYEVCQM